MTSPAALLLIVVGMVTTAGLALRSTAWSPRVLLPLRRARSAGQVLRAGWAAFREHLALMLAIGALFVPAAMLEVGLHTLVVELTPLGHLTDVAGERSLTAAALALLVAGSGHVLAATVVVGGVAQVLRAADTGRRPSVREAYRMLRARVRPLLGTSILVVLITLVLVVTVVGIPLAVFLLGRWAVAVQVAAIDEASPREALRRSRQLTAGRWWWTARLAALVNVLGAAQRPRRGHRAPLRLGPAPGDGQRGQLGGLRRGDARRRDIHGVPLRQPRGLAAQPGGPG